MNNAALELLYNINLIVRSVTVDDKPVTVLRSYSDIKADKVTHKFILASRQEAVRVWMCMQGAESSFGTPFTFEVIDNAVLFHSAIAGD